jgi:hypothetical protein
VQFPLQSADTRQLLMATDKGIGLATAMFMSPQQKPGTVCWPHGTHQSSTHINSNNNLKRNCFWILAVGIWHVSGYTRHALHKSPPWKNNIKMKIMTMKRMTSICLESCRPSISTSHYFTQACALISSDDIQCTIHYNVEQWQFFCQYMQSKFSWQCDDANL